MSISNTASVAADLLLPPVQTIAIAGGKGGIGKSCVAVNLAQSLSAAGRKVLLFDADFSHGNIDCLPQYGDLKWLHDNSRYLIHGPQHPCISRGPRHDKTHGLRRYGLYLLD